MFETLLLASVNFIVILNVKFIFIHRASYKSIFNYNVLRFSYKLHDFMKMFVIVNNNIKL